jgi:hypothetical protein
MAEGYTPCLDDRNVGCRAWLRGTGEVCDTVEIAEVPVCMARRTVRIPEGWRLTIIGCNNPKECERTYHPMYPDERTLIIENGVVEGVGYEEGIGHKR